ncbi:MAG: sigma-54 dependent transcriptional regulator [Thermodesulfobacteriota bacterium]
MNKERILIVEDDEYLRRQILWTLTDFYQVFEAAEKKSAQEILDKEYIHLLLLDLCLPPQHRVEEGMEILMNVRDTKPEMKVIIITAKTDKDLSLKAVDLGAYDYFTKPFDLNELKITIKRALKLQSMEQENRYLKEKLEDRYRFENIIYGSKKMEVLMEMVRKVASSSATVLIRGESGTGKEQIANAIHFNSDRRHEPFIKINCAALPENLLETELFGHEKGAFTGAISRRQGRFELVKEGTIFLDEVGDLSPNLQIKLSRVLQEKEFERVGGTTTIKTDFRLIAATNQDLEKKIANGAFREELYYRINVMPIFIPPLRERKEDIPLLVGHFLKKYNKRHYRNVRTLTGEAMNLLVNYDWRGNVRELENVIESSIIFASGDILDMEDLMKGGFFRKMDADRVISGKGKELHSASGENNEKSVRNETTERLNCICLYINQIVQDIEVLRDFKLGDLMPQIEKELIRATLKKMGGNLSHTSQVLDMTRKTLRKKMAEYNLSRGNLWEREI